MTILGQDWPCARRRKYSVGRQSAFSCRSIPFLGQDWLCSHRRKHSVARQRALSYRSIPFLGQDWLCSRRGMTFLGQDWSYSHRRKHSVGRQSALSCRSIPFLGQEWLCSRRRMTILGQDWSYLGLIKESRHSRRSLFAVLAFQKEYYRTFYVSKALFFGKNDGIITKKRYFCKLNRYVTSACNQNSRKLYASFFLTQIIMNSHELSVCKAGHI